MAVMRTVLVQGFTDMTMGALSQHCGVFFAPTGVSQPLQHITVFGDGLLVLPYDMLTLVGEHGLARQRPRARRVPGGLLGRLPGRATRDEADHRHEVVVPVGPVGGAVERPELLRAGGLAPERLRGVDVGVAAAALLHRAGGGRVAVGCDAAVQDVDGPLVFAGDREAEEHECPGGSQPHVVRAFDLPSLTVAAPLDPPPKIVVDPPPKIVEFHLRDSSATLDLSAMPHHNITSFIQTTSSRVPDTVKS